MKPREPRIPWTLDEVMIVERGIADGLPTAEICAKLPGRSRDGIEDQCKRRRAALGMPDQRTPWTPGTIEALIAGIEGGRSYAAIGAEVGLDKEAVRRKARYLRLKPRGPIKPYAPRERSMDADDGGGYWSPKKVIAMDERFAAVLRRSPEGKALPQGIDQRPGTRHARPMLGLGNSGCGSPAALCSEAG